MNYLDTLDLEEMKRAGYKTDRERVLLEALTEAEAAKDALTGIFNDYPSTDDIRPDLEHIRDTLREVKETAERLTEAYFEQDKNQPLPKEDTAEWLAFKIADLFSDTIMCFDDLEALDTAGEVYEIAERANVAVYA